MTAFKNISFRRTIALLILVMALLASGTWLTVKLTTDHLINDNARLSARDWARFLAINIADLKQIASGEPPSESSLAILEATRRSGQVFRYVVFNRQGYSQLLSDHDNIRSVDVSEFSTDAAQSIATGQTIISTFENNTVDMPAYFATAFVPVNAGGETIAVVAAYVDETEQSAAFHSTFLISALTLCGLTALSFGAPAIAWYRRTQEKQQADRRIHFMAHHDALTGLANRAQLIEKLDRALALLPSMGGNIAVHFIDLDRFKTVNDSLGHDGGDFLLRAIGQRLATLTRIEDVVARLGGDEFVIVQAAVSDRAQAEAPAQRITAVLREPIKFKEQEIKANATIGVGLAPADGRTSETLLKSADLALYAGKAAGRNCIRFFAPEMDEAMQNQLKLEQTIRSAIANEGFALRYQPIFEIRNNRLIGYEALVRLLAEDGTLIPPDQFIPVAEDLHLIDKVGAWVLREACKVAATWPKNLTIAVNLSPTQFESGTITEVVAAALEEWGLDPSQLELEVVETLLLGDNERTMQQLRELKALGVSIVMDDFGTGYSSLSYLWKFPFDKIKIDRSFMQNFEQSGRDVETVIKSIIALGRQLRMRVTVEGVETSSQAAFLRDADADQVQGFYFGRPMQASEVSANILSDFRNSLPATRLPDGGRIKLVKS